MASIVGDVSHHPGFLHWTLVLQASGTTVPQSAPHTQHQVKGVGTSGSLEGLESS